jgi:hypothetical protein
MDSEYVMTVNKFQYHHYVATDVALMNVALDSAGFAHVTRNTLLYAARQAPEKGFVKWEGLLECFGHVLWSFDRHYEWTRDQSFLEAVYPNVKRALEWELAETAKDALGLLPLTSLLDDSVLANVHQTGHQFWALIGLKAAERLARAAGDEQTVARCAREYNRLFEAVDRQLKVQTAKTGGAIPPALDRTLAGNSWDNLHTLYPEQLFDPADRRVDATITATRATYREGILPYVWPEQIDRSANGAPVFNSQAALHYFHTPDNAESQLVRGGPHDQQDAVADLYGLLLHTTSTHATQEWGTHPWSTRDYEMRTNILPDGSTSAVLISLLRNMLVREDGPDLYLFSALSPEWLRGGKRLSISNAPTNFGPVSAGIRADPDGLVIDLAPHFRLKPRSIVIRTPWFFELTAASADGRAVTLVNGALHVNAGTRQIRLRGGVRSGSPRLSFLDTVARYREEYARRYRQFLESGELSTGKDPFNQ